MTEPTATPVELGPPPALVDGNGMPDAVAADVNVASAEGMEVKTRSQWSYARRRFFRHRLAMIGLFGLVVIFGAGAFANLVAPYAFDQIDLTNVLHGPTTIGHHYFGTDEIGRDYLSRVIYGIRTSEQVGLVVAVVSSIFGLIFGAIAGYYRGWVDNLMMRVTDLVLTLPVLVTLLTVAALLGGGSQWTITFI